MGGVVLTAALQQELERHGQGASQVFADEFAAWRKNGANVLFGKDGPYRKPLVQGEPKLMHVHLIPGLSQTEQDLWIKKWTLRRPASHRTSDHVLVYVIDDYGDALLIAILDEPGAHAIAEMRTPRDAETMEGFAAVAEEYCATGRVIA